MHTFARLLIGLASAAALPAAADAADNLFPFTVSYDAPQNATNVSSWFTRPAGKQGFVRVQNGKLVNDAGPIRFFGTNLCFDACFPTHEQAEGLAARLARFGVNVVRMHHMDSHSIWGNSPNQLTMDPAQLERLDYLIYRLKREGVYTNLNLHVSRWLGPAEGFPDRERRPSYDKGLDNFEPRMIELQKKYARDLLTHVNPYTGKAYAEETAIAFVEINNENALFHEWSGGGLDNLPEPYATAFRQLWNAWLRKKFQSTDALREAWRKGEQSLGAEMLASGDFSKPLDKTWILERDEESQAAWTVEPKGLGGKPVLRVAVHRPGSVPWRPQFSQGGFAVKKGEAYTLTFQCRADAPRTILLNCKMAHEPWVDLGLADDAAVDTQWRRQRFTFLADQDDANARITFTNLAPGVYEFADVSLKPGGLLGLRPDEELEGDKTAVLSPGRRDRTEAAQSDFLDFLWDTEQAYWSGMHHFLKVELHVRAPISGTQLSWSPVHIQAGLDYLDAHSYWQHPHFPGRPWDSQNWYVNDTAMVNSPGGTLTELAGRRVAGKPFTVSEYNHPTPNRYAAEGLPMLAAMGAFQAWDGIYSFAWSHDDHFDPRKLDGYFDIQAEPTRLVHLPACAAMFLRGDVPPARTLATVSLTPERERRRLHESGTAWSLTAGQLGAGKNLALLHGVGISLHEGANVEDAKTVEANGSTKVHQSDNGALLWDCSKPDHGFFVVNSPRTKLFTGFAPERAVQLGDVSLEIGATRLGWATISLTCLDGAGFERSGRVLIAATGWRQNADWRLEDLGDNRVTLRNPWGREPILCEGIPATITLPAPADGVECYALDSSGNRTERVPASSSDGKARMELAPKYQTLWYEVEIK